jgi:hypothetical protein
MYRRLESAEITGTALALSDRISARFPGSGLSRVAKELVGVCQDAAQTATWLARPRKLLRAGVAVGLMVIFVALLGTVLGVRVRMAFTTFSEFVQGLQAGIQNLVFLGIAVLFLLGLERRWKRRRAVSALHSLRSIAHIIDMHQLAKDPETWGSGESGAEALAAPDLIRYLDFCSDLLAVISKAAALHVQDFDDPVTLAAVNEIEDLTAGLSRKIWQKIMILDRIANFSASRAGAQTGVGPE